MKAAKLPLPEFSFGTFCTPLPSNGRNLSSEVGMEVESKFLADPVNDPVTPQHR